MQNIICCSKILQTKCRGIDYFLREIKERLSGPHVLVPFSFPLPSPGVSQRTLLAVYPTALVFFVSLSHGRLKTISSLSKNGRGDLVTLVAP